MRRGLFGKLQTKRDFVAPGAPREFLAAWEPWLQSAVSASRVALGDGWRAVYLTAPIWRFWLGSEICGATAIGALMSSMDGVGRYFPLTLIFMADEGEDLPPPEITAHDEWFEQAEDFLLTTLDLDRRYEQITAALVGLPEPFAPEPRAAAPVTRRNGATIHYAGEERFSKSFELARRGDAARANASSTFWWTNGGPGYPRLTLSAQRLPDPSLFANMITGRFEEGLPAAGKGDSA